MSGPKSFYEKHEKLITAIYAALASIVVAACVFAPTLWGGN